MNARWIFLLPRESGAIFREQLLDLPARQYHYGGRKASPTHTGVENGFQFLGKSRMYM